MKRIIYITAAMLAVSCANEVPFDAQGTFEADEVIVSSEANGLILSFNVEEGEKVEAGMQIAEIDSVQLDLQRKQLMAQLSAVLGASRTLRSRCITQGADCRAEKRTEAYKEYAERRRRHTKTEG